LVRKGVVLAVVVALLVVLAGLGTDAARAKDYSITDVVIDARVMTNGDVRVHESRTLDFSGAFSYVYWDYSTRGSEGVRIRAASGPEGPYTRGTDSVQGGPGLAPGTYYVLDKGDTVRVQLSFSLADTSATFSVDYTALSAARRWRDTAELYWQFVGAETGVPCDHVRITVHLPRGVQKNEVRAWTHGPLWGTVTIEPDASVVSAVSPLPANTYVESRILFPAAALAKVKPSDGARMAAALSEEQRWADEANRQRQRARVGQILWGVLGAGVPLAAFLLVVTLYIKYGREPKPRFRAQYLREIPEPPQPPAMVGFVWRMGSLAREDATATLLDLIDRGVIDIERVVVPEKHLFGKDERTTYRLTLHDDRLEDLLPYERRLAKLLFHEIAEGPSFLLSELKDLAKTNRAEFAKGYSAWRTMVENEGERRKFFDATADRMAFWAAAAGFAAAVAAGAAGVLSGGYWYFLGVPFSIALIVAARAVKRRSTEAAELHAQYGALRRYLKDFGRLQEKPPDAVVLWQQFLVYAVVFGIADEVVKTMQVKAPEVVDDPAFRTTAFLMFAAPGGGGSPLSELHQSFTQAVAVATSSSSSGSGGGGGFSGGGGGGGGGGGFGAG
jgi:uncharacterized membrane protein